MRESIKKFISADLSTPIGRQDAKKALSSCLIEANKLNMVPRKLNMIPRKHSLLMRILLAIVHFFQLLLVVWPIFIFTKKLVFIFTKKQVKSKQPSNRILSKTITQKSIDHLTEEQLTRIRISIVNQQNSGIWDNAGWFLNLISNIADSQVTTPISDDWWSLWIIKGKKDFKSLKEATPEEVNRLAQQYPNIREFYLMSQYYQLTSSGSTDPASISESVSLSDWDKNDDTALIQILDHVEKLQTPGHVDIGNNRLIQVMQRQFSYLGRPAKRKFMENTQLHTYSKNYREIYLQNSIISDAVFSDTLSRNSYSPVPEVSQEFRKFDEFTHDVLKRLGLNETDAEYAHFPMTTVFGYKLFSKKDDAAEQEDQFIKDVGRHLWSRNCHQLGQNPEEINKGILGVAHDGKEYISQENLSDQQKAVRFITQTVGFGDVKLMSLFCKMLQHDSYSRSYHSGEELIFEYVTVFYPSLEDKDVAIVSNKFKFRLDGHIELECYAHIPKKRDLWPLDKFQILLSWLDSQMSQVIGLPENDKVISLNTKTEEYHTENGLRIASKMLLTDKRVLDEALAPLPRSGADSLETSPGPGM